MAYKVYYGYLTSGGTGYTDYYNWTSRTLIYDTADVNDENSNYLLNSTLTMTANEAGSFEADVPKSNVCYDDLQLMLGTIEIEEDGEIIWQGRITQIDTDFDLNKHIYCEGELAYLNDYVIEVKWEEYKGISIVNGTFGYYPINYFSDLINCKIASNGKWITNDLQNRANALPASELDMEIAGMSLIEKTGSNTNISVDDTRYKSAWEGLQNDFIDGLMSAFEGYTYVYLHRTHDSHGYKRLLDLIVVTPPELRSTYGNLLCGRGLVETTSQTIEYGKNLTDINVKVGMQSDVCTQVTAFGYETTGWWIFEKTSTIAGNYVDQNGVVKYGVIQKAFSVDGESSTTSSLNTAAENAATSTTGCYEYKTVSASAIDLYDANEATDHLRFMKMTHIKSDPHGVDGEYLCTGCTIPLDDPTQKEYTFGSTVKKLSRSQSSTDSIADKGYTVTKSIKSYVTNS